VRPQRVHATHNGCVNERRGFNRGSEACEAAANNDHIMLEHG